MYMKYELRYTFPAVLTVGLINDAVSAAPFSFKAFSFHLLGETEEGFENSQSG